MFYSITGKVVFYEEGRLAVATPGGVAYELLVSNATLAKLGRQGETVTVYCRLAVAQDDVRLFGFYSKEEKAMFENLTSVGGVGGKLALQILSSVDVSTLAIAIVGGDAATLSKVKGIGKKTAERIILELREQVSSSATAIAPTDIMPTSAVGDATAQDAIAALVSLGISKTEAYTAVAAAMKKTDKLEQIIGLGCDRLLTSGQQPSAAKLGVDGNRMSASLYDMIPAKPQHGGDICTRHVTPQPSNGTGNTQTTAAKAVRNTNTAIAQRFRRNSCTPQRQ